jgi:5-methylcytosine-specific restriction endonuclease McrA
MYKQKIPKALREQIWLRDLGKKYEGKCRIVWCENKMTVFDFQCGHDIPESHGGQTILENLVPICSRCNLSMSNTYTIKQWNQLSKPQTIWRRILRFFRLIKSDTENHGIQSFQKNMNQKDKLSKLHGK